MELYQTFTDEFFGPHLRCWEVPDGCTKTSSLFYLFVDGENEVGKVTSVTPPKLRAKPTAIVVVA